MCTITEQELQELKSAVVKKEFDVGGYWDSHEWQIHLNEVIDFYESDNPPCPHIKEIFEVEHVRLFDGSKYRWKYAVCPRVVVAINEGGFNSTGICLDCILEAAKTFKK